VGLQPEAVDYSDLALPPGMDAKKIRAGIELGLKQMTDRGWHADACLIQPDGTAGPTLERQPRAPTDDCIGLPAGGGAPAQEPFVVRDHRQYRAQGCAQHLNRVQYGTGG